MGPGESSHLGDIERINLGSYYTPQKYVNCAAGWFRKCRLGRSCAVADLSCGYGAFFELQKHFPECRYIGNDIDTVAISEAKARYPFIHAFNHNALQEISRERYGIAPSERLIIVGNPPYNDSTSLVGRGKKRQRCAVDEPVRARDIGISSLLSYALLGAEYVAVLHPLSYLIKPSNFKSGRAFFENYELAEHIIFSSQEFAGTSRQGAFPVIAALYHRQPGQGITYDKICQRRFDTVEGGSFCIAERDYVSEYIAKYPHRRRYTPELLFYTLRDVNALKRCRTFIAERCANAVDINPAELAYYCYIDCFKEFAEVPYWMGNLDVPFIKRGFDRLQADFIAVSQSMHPEIFPAARAAKRAEIARVREYIRRVTGQCNGVISGSGTQSPS